MYATLISMLIGAGEKNAGKQGGESGFGTARSFQDALDPFNLTGNSSSSILGNIIDPGNVLGANPQLSANGNPRVNGGAPTPTPAIPGLNGMSTGMDPTQQAALFSSYNNFLKSMGLPQMTAPAATTTQPAPTGGQPALWAKSPIGPAGPSTGVGGGSYRGPAPGGSPGMFGGPAAGGYGGLSQLVQYLNQRQQYAPTATG